MQIVSIYDASKVLFECAAKTILETLIEAVKNRADLRGADLRGADLRGADLRGANLCGADLRGADLYGADLCGANLCGADLYGADLRGADLRGADLRGADLRGANLCGADLRGADLCGANLRGAKNVPDLANAQSSILPDSGPFFGWKKCRDGVIVQLAVGAKSKRSNASGRKCRAEYVKVLAVIGSEVGISLYDGKTAYRKNEIVRCDKWNEDRWEECGGGVHFYLTRIEAENHS